MLVSLALPTSTYTQITGMMLVLQHILQTLQIKASYHIYFFNARRRGHGQLAIVMRSGQPPHKAGTCLIASPTCHKQSAAVRLWLLPLCHKSLSMWARKHALRPILSELQLAHKQKRTAKLSATLNDAPSVQSPHKAGSGHHLLRAKLSDARESRQMNQYHTAIQQAPQP